MTQDALLAELLLQPAPHSGVTSGLRQVVLTGATGFVGVVLLRALLDHSTARVVCPVCVSDDAAARLRVRERLASAGLAQYGLRRTCAGSPPSSRSPSWSLHGALSTTRSRMRWRIPLRGERESLDATYQSDAYVLASSELLRFACAGAPKAFHHVSTLAVGLGAEPMGPCRSATWTSMRGCVTATRRASGFPSDSCRKPRPLDCRLPLDRLGRVTGPDPRYGNQRGRHRVAPAVAGISVGGLPQSAWFKLDSGRLRGVLVIVAIASAPRAASVYNLAPNEPVAEPCLRLAP